MHSVLRIGITLLAAAGWTRAEPSVDEIVRRMEQADDARSEALRSYSSTRRYRVENKRFNKTGEVVAAMTFTRPATRSFTVISESGSGFIRKRVLMKMIEAEKEAAGQRDRTRMTAANYTFRLVGPGEHAGRACWILAVEPKTANKFLVRGRVWVDREDYAVVRFEGSPAKNPSFWIRETRIVQQYARQGPFWFPQLNQSRSEVRVFGATDTTIEYFDYKVDAPKTGDGRAVHLVYGTQP